MKPWKPEYVELLRHKIEELRHVSLIDDRGSNEDPGIESLSRKQISSNIRVQDVNIKKSKKSIKKGKNRRIGHIRLFQPDEDALLMSTKVKSRMELLVLAKQLDRTPKSIEARIKKLQLTGTSTRSNKPSTLEEDFIIIDAAVQILLLKKDKLDQLSVNYQDLCKTLVRRPDSIYKRWERDLKVWLLGFYSKTLNLDIRIMLANALADNFKDIDSIDWEYVKTFSEFKGHTVKSLRDKFFGTIFRRGAKHLNIEKTELTLKEIAEDANVAYKENCEIIPETKKIRQMKVIEYFESQVKKFGLKDFL